MAKDDIDKEIDSLKLEQFKKDLASVKKRVAEYLSKPELKKLYFSDKTGQELKGTALYNKLLGAERKYLSEKIASVKKKTESVKKKTENVKKVADAENKLQKEIVKDIKIEQNNRKKQTFINNALQKDSIKRNYKASAWLSNIFKNAPINRNLPSEQRPLIQNNKNTPILSNLLGMNVTMPNMMGKLANKPINSNDALQFAINSSNGGINFNALANVPISKFTNIAGVHQGKFINKSTTGIHTVPTQKESTKNILTQSLKTFNTKKINNVKSLVNWLLNNKFSQESIDLIMFDANGKQNPISDIEAKLQQEKLNIIALQNVGKPVSKSYNEMSITDKILYNKDKNRKILLNKYGQGIAKKDPNLFDSITSSGDDKEILNILENMYNAEKAQIQMAKDAEKARKEAEKARKEAEKAQRKADIEERRNKAIEQKNLREQQKLLKQQQRLLEQEQKERKQFFKDLMSAPKPFNFSKKASDIGYGGLGLLGAIPGAIFGGLPGLALKTIGGVSSGLGGILGGVAGAVGAGLGFKGIFGGNKGLQSVPTKGQAKAGGILGKVGGVLGGFGGGSTKLGKILKPGAKLGAKVGAGTLKGLGSIGLGAGKFAGKIFGKIPGLGMLFKANPYINAIVGIGALGMGIYDAWNSTDNTMDFLKESAWNTSSNLLSIATLGIIDADDAKNFGKKLASRIEDSDIYKNAKSSLQQRLKQTRLRRMYINEFGDEDPNIRILENAKKRYRTDSVFTRREMTDSELYRMNKLGIVPNDLYKRTNKESLPDYFWNNRTALKSKNNLLIPSWVKDTRGQLTDNFKNMKLGGDLFNLGSTNSVRNSNTTTNNNSVVNVYNEPQQNKTTAIMALGGAVPFMGMVLYQ